MLRTPLEQHDHARLSTPEEIAAYLGVLAAQTPGATLWPLGHSAGGRPLTALRLPARRADQPCLRVLLVGCQHGASEAAGGEALLMLARQLAGGGRHGAVEYLEFVIYPDANPDGRALDSSRNAEEVNINRDFVLLTQPESRALDRLLREFAPHIVLDAHESAILKPQSLAREGYMTDFETQFDCGNNPAIPGALRAYAEHSLLPALIARVAAHGVPAQRYIREILSVSQVASHGGLTARKFRNRAGLSGALSFLLETRMDPKHGTYPSFRNIAVRAAKQLLAQRVFVELMAERRTAVHTLLAEHAISAEPLVLEASYGARAPGAVLHIPLRRIADHALHDVAFADHRAVVCGATVALAPCYWVSGHHAAFARLLSTHGYPWQVITEATTRVVQVQQVAASDGPWPDTRRELRELPAGSLRVPVEGVRGRLLALLLEPRSSSSVFRYAAFTRLLIPGAECCVFGEAR